MYSTAFDALKKSAARIRWLIANAQYTKRISLSVDPGYGLNLVDEILLSDRANSVYSTALCSILSLRAIFVLTGPYERTQVLFFKS